MLEETKSIRLFREWQVETARGVQSVEVAGAASSSDTVLLINAEGVALDVWFPMVESLASGFQVVTANGLGAVGGRERESPVQARVEILLALVDALDKPCHVIGWCTGAGLAVILAARLGRKVRSLTLVNGAYCLAGYEGPQTEFEVTMPQLMTQAVASAGSTRAMYQLFRSVTTGDVVIGEGAGLRYAPWTSRVYDSLESFTEYASAIDSYNRTTIDGYLDAIQARVLLISGSHDTTAHSNKTRHVAARIANSQLEVLPSMDHYGLHNDPRVPQLISGFLLDVAAAASRSGECGPPSFPQ